MSQDIDTIIDQNQSDEYDESLRAKWILDGASTLDECIEKCHKFINYIEKLKEDGYQLINTIDDDLGFIRKTI